ncbi:hypothetical protein E9840_11235 [Tissierella creatinini]|nr:hypothetical protein E9840_11235 [Tissierella creatinini]TJX62908.1 hypothetical protein E8P77_16290 [Soehngenia saccharolytica]
MSRKFEYIEKIKSNKTKAITISLEENLINDIEKIAEELEVSRNRIISEALEKFSEDYDKFNEPNYYLFNATQHYTNISNAHLHMLLGNKISIWGITSAFDESEMDVGDYVFIWLDDYGIIGAGEIITEPISSNYSIVGYTGDDETAFKIVEESYININYDKISLHKGQNAIDTDNTLSYEVIISIIDHLKEKYSDLNERYNAHFDRYKLFINNMVKEGSPFQLLPRKLGKELKERYLGV